MYNRAQPALYRSDAFPSVVTEEAQHLHRERSIEGRLKHPHPVVQRPLLYNR